MPRKDGMPTAQEAEERFQWQVRTRNEKIAKLRERSGMSMDDLAKAMGFRGQSSIQRYLSPDYSMGFRPEIAARFRKALIGKGEPPITDKDLQVFLDGRLIPPGDTVYDPMNTAHGRGIAEAALSIDQASWRAGTMKASLPLLEGQVNIEMPVTISSSSADAVRVWLAHLVNLTSDQNVNSRAPKDGDPEK